MPLDDDETDELADTFRQLVSQAREYVKINRVHLDRGFYRVHLALALEKLDVEFVMRALQTRKVQRFFADLDDNTFLVEYEMVRSNPPTGRTTVRFVVVPHRSREDEHFCLVTNHEITRDLAPTTGRSLPTSVRYRNILPKGHGISPENIVTYVLCPVVLLSVCLSLYNL